MRKCPYQTMKVIYRPQSTYNEKDEKIVEKEITTFADCLLIECPFYHKDSCLRAGREIMTEVKL